MLTADSAWHIEGSQQTVAFMSSYCDKYKTGSVPLLRGKTTSIWASLCCEPGGEEEEESQEAGALRVQVTRGSHQGWTEPVLPFF